MKENKTAVTYQGTPLTLLGEPTVVGNVAPDFSATDTNGQQVHLSDFRGKTIVLSVFPSIDTKVCATQTRTFNSKASALGSNVVVLTLSKDLPFALGRFCGAEGIDRVHPLSDYMHSEFGKKYGFLIQENQLLARGVVVIDKKGAVTYVEYVPELTSEPNYDGALAAVAAACKM